jgi:hypothetical protein
MKRLLLTLALALWAGPALSQGAPIGPPNWFTCASTAQITGTAGTTAQIVALATSPVGPGGVQPRIYVCGWTFTYTAASGTIQLSYGTGSNCGTGNTVLTPPLSVGATQVSIYTNVPSVQTAPGNALCVNTSVVTITGLLWFTQF